MELLQQLCSNLETTLRESSPPWQVVNVCMCVCMYVCMYGMYVTIYAYVYMYVSTVKFVDVEFILW